MANKDLDGKDAKPGKVHASNASDPNRENESLNETLSFPVVALGASAGGLEALKSFFRAVPEKTEIAYLVAIHLSPKQPSMLAEILAKESRIPVATAVDGERVKPGRVYVMPPEKDLRLFRGKILLLDQVAHPSPHIIDEVFISVAKECQKRAVAVVLSGTGTDGARGIRDIKTLEGLVIAQSEDSAAYSGMPKSAADTGLVDMVLPPEEMPVRIERYLHGVEARITAKQKTKAKTEEWPWLDKVFSILRQKVGHDFSAYKRNTLVRRVARRMGINQIDDHQTYVRYLRENPNEVEALFRELLIGVTSFFRDPESYEMLKKSVLPDMIASLPADSNFRVWVPGCSTGEEAYSLAMLIRECLGHARSQVRLQVFATDIDPLAIEKAREGLYPGSIGSDVSDERLRRFFTKEGDFFRIRKEVRDCVVFSVQNVIKDPPFSRLNLLCCRNLLIYLVSEAQRKLLPLFHYTLVPEGVLVLGSSETIGRFVDLFDVLDKRWKVFRKKGLLPGTRQALEFPSGSRVGEGEPAGAHLACLDARRSIGLITEKAILEQFAPAAVLVDSSGELLYVQGRTGKFLEAPSGHPTQNIVDLARDGLRIELASAMRAARTSNERITRKKVGVKSNGHIQWINLHVCPQHAPKEIAGLFLVFFEEIQPGSVNSNEGPESENSPVVESTRIVELEKELQVTRESHQTAIEELESSNEELKSTNEEMQSANEELQSTNEELESSKEELQSLNEELQTVNAELQSKVEELYAAHDDMRNLLNSTEIATIFVDNEMRIRRFTPEACRIINLIHTDIGRPLKHVVSNLVYERLIDDLSDVLRRLVPREAEVTTNEGVWYKMRIVPYRTTDNRIDGAVLTFMGIQEQKAVQERLRSTMEEREAAHALANQVFEMTSNPMLVLDEGYCVTMVNEALLRNVDKTREAILGKPWDDALGLGSEGNALRSGLLGVRNEGAEFGLEPVSVRSLGGDVKAFRVDGRVIRRQADLPWRILLQFSPEA